MMMRKLLIFFLACFSANLMLAQCRPPSVNREIGTRLFGLTDASKMGGATNLGAYKSHPSLLSGIHFKAYRGIGAFRASFGITNFKFEDDKMAVDCSDCYDTDVRVYGGIMKLGYEAYTIFGRLEPYAALDGFVSYDQYSSEVTGNNENGEYTEFTERRGRTGVGVSPSLGLRFFMSYALSISAETSLNGGLYMNRNTTNAVSPIPDNTTIEDNGFDWEFHPVNWVSLNVMF